MNRKEFFVDLDWGIDRLRFRYDIEKGQMKDFVIQYETFFGNKWNEVIRYDCTHGFFHRDEMFRNKKQIKTELDIQDLNAAALYAEQDLRDRWNWYKNRFFKNIKQ